MSSYTPGGKDLCKGWVLWRFTATIICEARVTCVQEITGYIRHTASSRSYRMSRHSVTRRCTGMRSGWWRLDTLYLAWSFSEDVLSCAAWSAIQPHPTDAHEHHFSTNWLWLKYQLLFDNVIIDNVQSKARFTPTDATRRRLPSRQQCQTVWHGLKKTLSKTEAVVTCKIK